MKRNSYGVALTAALTAALTGCAASKIYIGELPAPHGGIAQYQATSQCNNGALESQFSIEMPDHRTLGVNISTSSGRERVTFDGSTSIREFVELSTDLGRVHKRITNDLDCKTAPDAPIGF